MNIVFILGFLFLNVLSCKAQELRPPQLTVPVENTIDYLNNDTEIPDGVYLKGVNHLLDKYVGMWIADYNNKTYEFHVVEFTDNFLDITEDILQIRYKITDTNGNIVENTLNLPDDSPYVISGRYLSANEANYILSYVSVAECGQDGTVYINTVNNGIQMNLVLVASYEHWGCPNGLEAPVFPLAGDGYIALAKQ